MTASSMIALHTNQQDVPLRFMMDIPILTTGCMTDERCKEFDRVTKPEKFSMLKPEEVQRLSSSVIKTITGDVRIEYVASYHVK